MDLLAQTRTARVKQAAVAAGAQRVAIATIAPPPRWEAFQAALAAGLHGEMAWLAREDSLAKRADPSLLLPGARSIVAMAFGYPRGEEPAPGPLRGRIARYARGRDYHDVLPQQLGPVAEELRAMGGEARVITDSAPLLEVSHAARAGLGWVGKNGLLLHRDGGTWVILAEVLTTLELVADGPETDHCGSCTRCLEACPTQAFRGPYVLDAQRCLSYLTIELKGPIPRELRPGLGNWIFGCDVCQEVCPWSTRFARRDSLPDLAAAPDRLAPDLLELLRLDEPSFRERFRGTPLFRTKRRGLLRNVCVALGNAGDRRAVPALAAVLGDPEPLIRGHAAWALGRLGGPGVQAALEQALRDEEDPTVREELAQALAGL